MYSSYLLEEKKKKKKKTFRNSNQSYFLCPNHDSVDECVSETRSPTPGQNDFIFIRESK